MGTLIVLADYIAARAKKNEQDDNEIGLADVLAKARAVRARLAVEKDEQEER